MSDKEITVTTQGVTLKGEVVDDVRQPIKRFAETADSILRLISNVLRLPADFISNNLESFRIKYQEKFDEIPIHSRQEPSMRIGCSVLRNVAYSADEADIQELFANLLASACDSTKAEYVHPGFATIISELRGIDAKVLVVIAKDKISLNEDHDINKLLPDKVDVNLVSQAISNLIRLGLLGWKEQQYRPHELQKFVGKAHYSDFLSERDIPQMLVDLINDVQRFKNELINEFLDQHQRQKLVITRFGQAFIDVALKPKES